MKLLSVLFASMLGCFLGGCQKADDAPEEFSNYETIADLATIECYYHNVAEIRNPGTDYLFHLVNVGYKKAWFEYRGSVVMGIDASKVSISNPDENNVVTITIPEAQVLGVPRVEEDSFSDVYSDKGLIQAITNEDMAEALQNAEEQMKKEAENDAVLVRQAKSRAKLLLEQYVVNIGKAKGVDYKVKFEPAKESSQSTS